MNASNVSHQHHVPTSHHNKSMIGSHKRTLPTNLNLLTMNEPPTKKQKTTHFVEKKPK